MVAIDAASGSAVRVGGAALVSGPTLTLRSEGTTGTRGLHGFFSLAGLSGSMLPGLGVRRPAAVAPWQGPDGAEPAAPLQGTQPQQAKEVLPPVWGTLGFSPGALFSPPYELASETMQWQLSSDTRQAFRPADRGARMAQRVHPRGPSLQTAGSFLSALYGLTPTPAYLGVGLDFGA